MFEQKTSSVEGPGTIVGANVKLSGTLKDINDITIHGKIEGEVISDKSVTIEQNASVKGPIHASTVVIAGKVDGEVLAEKKLEILETGNVKGSIATNDLIIKSGAVFNGKCNMHGEEDKVKTTTKTVSTNLTSKDKNPSKSQTNKKYELE